MRPRSQRLERAARLFGAEEALREAIGFSLLPAQRAEHDRDVAAACTGLGEGIFASTWAEGRALPLDRAIREALGMGARGGGNTTDQADDTAQVHLAHTPDRVDIELLDHRE
jgi:hypothetical protein